jgi:hypothetical protein
MITSKRQIAAASEAARALDRKFAELIERVV